MAKGFDKNRERKAELSSFGKNLVRRSGSTCEICASTGTALGIYEIPPVPKEPDYDRCLFICDECREQLGDTDRLVPDHWRCLNNTVWSEVAAIQALSIRILRIIAEKHDWAEELLDQVYPDPEVEEMSHL